MEHLVGALPPSSSTGPRALQPITMLLVCPSPSLMCPSFALFLVDDGDFEVVEEIETIIEHVLGALRDKDTIVRWSAAKGVGRITGCLPKELGDEVVGHVLELFRPTGRSNLSVKF